MSPEDRSRLVVIAVNTAAAITLAILYDPGLRREAGALIDRLVSAAEDRYARSHEPDAATSAVLERAREITKEV
jgi:hypothetical protein